MKSEINIVNNGVLRVDDLSNGDVIRILSANNSYEFAITDSRLRRGTLSGGALGDRAFSALSEPVLREGYSARFVIKLDCSLGRLVTSAIKGLIRIGKDEPGARSITDFASSCTEVNSYAT